MYFLLNMGDCPFTVAILVVQGVCIIYMYIILYICTFPQTRRSFTEKSGEPFSWSFEFFHVCLCFVFITRWILVLGTFLPTTLFVSQLKSPHNPNVNEMALFLGGVSLVTRCWLTSQHLTETPGLCRNPKRQRTLSTRRWRGIIGGHLEWTSGGASTAPHARVFGCCFWWSFEGYLFVGLSA